MDRYFDFSKKRIFNVFGRIPLIGVLFLSTFCFGQHQGEFEVGIGSALYNEVGFSSDLETNLGCIQINLDHDLVKGPFRGSVGVDAVYTKQFLALLPGFRLGFDVFNLSLHLDVFTTRAFLGLGSRIPLGSDKRHAISLNQKVSPDIYGSGPALLYSFTTVGYSYRF